MMWYITKTEQDDRMVGSLVWGYSVNSIRNAHEQVSNRRERSGDFAFGAVDAEIYWGDYKRLNKLIAERMESETAEYIAGFKSIEH